MFPSVTLVVMLGFLYECIFLIFHLAKYFLVQLFIVSATGSFFIVISCMTASLCLIVECVEAGIEHS
jgi:hypothetical protein